MHTFVANLAGTPGVRFSPAVKIFRNLGEMLLQIQQAADAAGQPTAFIWVSCRTAWPSNR